MRKKILLLIVGVTVISCKSNEVIPDSEYSSLTTVNLDKGSEFIIDLPVQSPISSTGVLWNQVSSLSPIIKVDTSFTIVETSSKLFWGRQIWKITAKAAGTQEIEFRLMRPAVPSQVYEKRKFIFFIK
ncbi:hypothetical protein GOQ04_25260 [Emticicia sp. ODNR4P]|nr:hypothetical protein [Emticicia sp. ODNR4P]